MISLQAPGGCKNIFTSMRAFVKSLGAAFQLPSPPFPLSLSHSACLAAGPQVNAGASGCIATVVYALWGNWSRSWGMSNEVLRKSTLFTFWDVAVAALNGLIFFFTGAAATNFTIR